MLKTMTVQALIKYIEDNINVTLVNINNLVDFSGYSRRHLQNIFKNTMGMPVGKYITLRRVSRAAYLLRLTNVSLIEISDSLHYDSQQSFTREFKKNSGYTPLQYRKNHIWSFKNMTGNGKINAFIPAPTIKTLNEKKFSGKTFCYKEFIPNIETTSTAPKWAKIESLFYYGAESIYLSHQINLIKSNENAFNVRLVIWDKYMTSDCYEKLDAGLYAYFYFNGTVEEYVRFIYNIHIHSLSFYGICKRDGFDLEVIRRGKDGRYFFEYYLPIHDEINSTNVCQSTDPTRE